MTNQPTNQTTTTPTPSPSPDRVERLITAWLNEVSDEVLRELNETDASMAFGDNTRFQ